MENLSEDSWDRLLTWPALSRVGRIGSQSVCVWCLHCDSLWGKKPTFPEIMFLNRGIA